MNTTVSESNGFSFTEEEVAGMIDVAAVQSASSLSDIDTMVSIADRFNCGAVFALGEMTRYAAELLKPINERRTNGGNRPIRLGGVVGFPDGGALIEVKQYEAKRLLELGCVELDMVQNIGWAVSGQWEMIETEIRDIKAIIGDKTLKVILECPYLTDGQIVKSAQMAANGGADWIKTSTGWPVNKTTVDHVRLIKQAVGDRCKIKAAGGVRSLEILQNLYEAGTRQFGVSARNVPQILSSIK